MEAKLLERVVTLALSISLISHLPFNLAFAPTTNLGQGKYIYIWKERLWGIGSRNYGDWEAPQSATCKEIQENQWYNSVQPEVLRPKEANGVNPSAWAEDNEMRYPNSNSEAGKKWASSSFCLFLHTESAKRYTHFKKGKLMKIVILNINW